MMKNVFKRLIRWACKEELDEMHKKLGEMYENTDKLIRSGKELAQYGLNQCYKITIKSQKDQEL